MIFQGEISITGVSKTKGFQYSQQFVREQNVLALEECVRDQFLNLINLNPSPAFAPGFVYWMHEVKLIKQCKKSNNRQVTMISFLW